MLSDHRRVQGSTAREATLPAQQSFTQQSPSRAHHTLEAAHSPYTTGPQATATLRDAGAQVKRKVKSWRDRASSHLGQARVADVPAAQCAAPSDGPVSPTQVAHVSPAPAVVGDGHAVHMRGDLDGGDAEGGGSVGNHLRLSQRHQQTRGQGL